MDSRTKSWLAAARGFAVALAGVAALALGSADPAAAQTVLKVGKAVPNAFSFVPLEVGMAQGIFAKHGVAVESVGFEGGSKMQQALAAGSIQFGLGSGPEFQAMAKGAPNIGVAQMAGVPLLLGIIVLNDGPKTVDDLKGKKVSVSGTGSLTHWLVEELSRREGWGTKGIEVVGLGAMPSQLAAMKAGQVSGITVDLATGYRLEEQGEGHVLLAFGEIITDKFIMHMIWANKDYVAANADATKGFLAGWFETVQWMKDNKDGTVKIAAPIMGVSEAITARAYDQMFPMFNLDGHVDKAALERMAESFVEMGSLPEKVDLTPYYTEEYLPK